MPALPSGFHECIDDADFKAIQALRGHRDDLAHNLVHRLPVLRSVDYELLWNSVDRAIFKLSNHRAFMEIGADPEFQGIAWGTAKGGEYLLFEKAVEGVRLLGEQSRGAPKK